jgi:hypothetical protein
MTFAKMGSKEWTLIKGKYKNETFSSFNVGILTAANFIYRMLIKRSCFKLRLEYIT